MGEIIPPLAGMPQGQGCGPLLCIGSGAVSPLKQQIFEYVRSRGQAARADVTDALGISGGSVTTLTAELITDGFLREIKGPAREHARGRPRVALEVVPETAFVIGIKLAFNRHSAVLTDFSGALVGEAYSPAGNTRRRVQEVVSEISELIDILLKKTKKSWTQIKAVGVGMPGMIDHETGVIHWSPMLEDPEVGLSAELEKRFKVQVTVDNDANVLTLAELWFGDGRAITDFAVVTVEAGVGMGLVLGNQIYRGAHGVGLELGHVKVELDGALCQCGRRGCLEAYVADYALVREASVALGPDSASTDEAPEVLNKLYALAQSGHKPSQAVFEQSTRYLSLGLSNVIQLFDPEMIVLSGTRVQQGFLRAEDLVSKTRALTLDDDRRACRIVVNKWDGLIWARGASALALSSVTSDVLSGVHAA